MKKLDLHGIRHAEVDRLVENFILMNQDEIPLTIICGNSQPMIDLVEAVISRIKCASVTRIQFGVIRIDSI